MRQDREKPETELTAPHRKLISIIQGMGFQVTAEYPVGPYKLDCYLPEFHAGIEADGPGHSKSRDQRRSNVILDNYAIPLLHLATVVVELNENYVRQAIQEFVRDFTDDVPERKEAAKRYEREHDAR